MKLLVQKGIVICLMLCLAVLSANIIWAQTCPPVLTTGVASINNTWFMGQQANGSSGAPSAQRSSVRPVMGGGGGAGDNNDGTGTPNGGSASGGAEGGGILSKEDLLDISPVPARRYTMIKWSATEHSKLTVTMFDATGRFVLCRQYQIRQGVNELLITNLEALPAGVYFIKASDGAIYRNAKLRIQQ